MYFQRSGHFTIFVLSTVIIDNASLLHGHLVGTVGNGHMHDEEGHFRERDARPGVQSSHDEGGGGVVREAKSFIFLEEAKHLHLPAIKQRGTFSRSHLTGMCISSRCITLHDIAALASCPPVSPERVINTAYAFLSSNQRGRLGFHRVHIGRSPDPRSILRAVWKAKKDQRLDRYVP